MKRLMIICEGQSEQSFVENVLSPYLYNQGNVFDVRGTLIPTSKGHKGGNVSYDKFINKINEVLRNESTDTIVSTMVDFFKFPKVPNLTASYNQLNGDLSKVLALEKHLEMAIRNDRFIPYIQLHEYEALLFSNKRGFEMYLQEEESRKLGELSDLFPNPEDINSSPQKAPSKRILGIYPEYSKVVDGSIIAIEVGIQAMLTKCPHFNSWVTRLRERLTLSK
ncbi:DUF4276 family protein [Porphyromonas levii]|uniref:DUF4276 family protein n=1 Tax=Porphyromonas levii TaxID=28114 RepID=UPI001BA9EDE5|nr:DUF4276 family protein [Porphyromonas levii]